MKVLQLLIGKTTNVVSFDEKLEISYVSSKKSAFIYFSFKGLVLSRCDEIGKIWIFFLWTLIQIVSNYILGVMFDDFNINGLEQNSVILQVLANYSQVISEYWQIFGTLLDYVIIWKEVRSEDRCTQE